ncbi:dephospho-CoA kinase/protein folding accessory domain-containing protein [Caulifigura coniformis]|uniref:Dephospho-CoA kinase/protein folding accessory domain-containing protein n=1 Tax=Caulifigura coniformis TaxID=2527983 RepID=A0A517S7I9_9PLAN|nr:GrpB family protein [Caulifigura coniformis]QDT52087.1 dephospho-CoA kinase/protein folding accessory domain-containing protein [Caulifigura coniformis]
MERIVIVNHQPGWRAAFESLGGRLRAALGRKALRIDHIGSTSVPGLAAKDVLDIQVTVAGLEPSIEDAVTRAGYQRVLRIDCDHRPPGGVDDPAEWTKWFFRNSPELRRVNLHVRIAGRANQRYPLLFRDYLRAHRDAAEAYAQVKRALAERHASDADAYYDVKDPVCDIIMVGADAWAERTGWAPPASDC